MEAGRAPTSQAAWIDGAWGVDAEGRLVVEGIDGDESVESVVVLFNASGDRPSRFPVCFEYESTESGDSQQDTISQFFPSNWLSKARYNEQFGEDFVEHTRG